MPVTGAGGSLAVGMLVAGLASGVHCLGMCGGIVGAFAAGPAVVARPLRGPRAREWPRQLLFNLGRVSSYVVAGALVGALGEAGTLWAGGAAVRGALYALANLMLVWIGLALALGGGVIAPLERLGAPLWRRVQPLAARLMSARTLGAAYGAGAAWGWLPCGLVYAALAASAFAGSAAGGALAMLAFGLGTLPNMLAAGLAAARLRGWAARPAVRFAAGALVLGFGVLGIVRMTGIAGGGHMPVPMHLSVKAN